MTHGVDTGFLVAAEIAEHAEHTAARQTLATLVARGDLIATAPQVLAEFIVTDARRFTTPVPVTTARRFASQWWPARDVVHVFPDDDSTRLFLS